MRIEILNIPNYYCSYYILTLYQNSSLKFEKEGQFRKYDHRPLIIFRFAGKIYVIDNNDPVGFDDYLYSIATFYFVTNKLIGHKLYQSKKIRPLYPHYPINSLNIYLKLFRLNLISCLSIRTLLKLIKTLFVLPHYRFEKSGLNETKFIFFSSRLWLKETSANQIRASFIQYCQNDNRFQFEGGFRRRSDGNNLSFDAFLSDKTYSPKEFSKLSKRSRIVLNNPAVAGALSWRFAEYLNHGLFVVNFPFSIDLPSAMIHGKNIFSVSSVEEIPQVLDMIIESPDRCQEIAKGGKEFFEQYCTPEKQWRYIMTHFPPKT